MAQFLFITDLDNTLVGDDEALATLNERLLHHRKTYGTRIVYSTGRSHQSYLGLREEKRLIEPDAVINGVGTEIYLADQSSPNSEWSEQLTQGWNRDRILASVTHFADLTPQPQAEQNPFKISFFLSDAVASDVLPRLEQRLKEEGFAVNIIYSSGQDLDLLPIRANKGLAMTFLREAWQFNPQRTVACGDSGNDRALFERGEERGIIVGNAQPELREWHQAHPSPHRYMAEESCAGGIMEGLLHFGFFA
ncbi:sucrose-phosphate phosphatase [Vacuolonema iberomarrocanum]|uniref:sucrose-phosphate phosphatase n=1 Tax=Vacuolonema iberomarrocanum TaxID=3454632 RepID=UPI001A06266F|nr:sucrose-phosphate phosphatase [filamentous cyanobacterium LEGE 07170]